MRTQTCRECGCTAERACVLVTDGTVTDTCGWAEPDLCNACQVGWRRAEWQSPTVQRQLVLYRLARLVLAVLVLLAMVGFALHLFGVPTVWILLAWTWEATLAFLYFVVWRRRHGL
jgi:hypothetical protein